MQYTNTPTNFSQISTLSNIVIKKFNPNRKLVKRCNKKWGLQDEPMGSSDLYKWEYTEDYKPQFAIRNKYIGNGLILLSKGITTNFTDSQLKHLSQTAPKIGETLRISISQKGEVIMIIPNLSKDSLLGQAGVTPEDMENLTTSTACALTNPKKEKALKFYWEEISAVADNVKIFDDSACKLARSSDCSGNPKSPYFNLALQTHYPQHLRFTLHEEVNFLDKNLFFNSHTGLETTLLRSIAHIVNGFNFPTVPPIVTEKKITKDFGQSY